MDEEILVSQFFKKGKYQNASCQFCGEVVKRVWNRLDAVCFNCRQLRYAIKNIKTPLKSQTIIRNPQLSRKIASMIGVELDI